jgi:hypothetical protein
VKGECLDARETMRLCTPDPEELHRRSRKATSVLVSAPYYSSEGLNWITPGPDGVLEFWTRLNPYDWAAEVAHPPSLLKLASKLGERRFKLRAHRALHAKVYVADNSWAWIGSANLTAAGHRTNLEAGCEFVGEEVAEVSKLCDHLRGRTSAMRVEDLEALYDLVADSLSKFQKRRGADDMFPELADAVELADSILKPVARRRTPAIATKDVPPLAAFIEFLRKSRQAAARVVVDRHEGDNSLQGHVKQSYFGAALFLLNAAREDVVLELLKAPLAEVPSLSPKAVEDWSAFLDDNAHLKSKRLDYSFATLRAILPERLGGYVLSGGGASPTFKRVLPLVTRFLREERRL